MSKAPFTAVNTLDEFQEYLERIMGNAEHHGQHVKNILHALVTHVQRHRDPGTPMMVRTNVLKVMLHGLMYYFTYNHVTGEVEMHRGSRRSPVPLHTFTNATPLVDVEAAFKALPQVSAAA